MTKNGIVLTCIAMLLGAAYVYYFTDLFRTSTIQIIPTVRPVRGGGPAQANGEPQVCPVSFSFDDKYTFTMVKVVNASELATNKYATPVWHLISDSNSVPTRSIVYGIAPKGMKPVVASAHPEALQPDVPYVLFLESGKLHGQTNFHTREIVAVGP